MANGLSVALPLQQSPIFGTYRLNTTFAEIARQNLKMLLLTNPGERMMDPEFGVGLQRYLFEVNTKFIYSEIQSRIEQQVKKYLPYIGIGKIEFLTSALESAIDPHYLGVNVSFIILPLNMSSLLQINANGN